MARSDVDRDRARSEPRQNGSGRRSDRSRGGPKAASADGIAKVASSAVRQLGALTGMKAEFVSRIQRGDDGWRLTIEVVEVPRIPDSTSVLGSYEVLVDGDGNLVEYARSRRYLRSRSVEWEV